MGGGQAGGLNILPKKRWHVRTWDNIQRVKRDEAKAAEEERLKQERATQAEGEARTATMRAKAADRRSELTGPQQSITDDEPGPSTSSAVCVDETGHVNFFAEAEAQEHGTLSGGNADHAAEKKKELEKWEKQIGLLKYLVDGDEKDNRSWYEKVPERGERPMNLEKKTRYEYKKVEVRDETRKRKRNSSPSSLEEKRRQKRSRRSPSSEGKGRHKKHKKNKKHKKERKEKKASPSTSKSLERLRLERHQREQAERSRTEALMRKLRGEPEEVDKTTAPVIEQRYSSQFNPEFCRQNRARA